MHKEEIREVETVRYLVFANLQAEDIVHGYTLRTGGVSQSPFDSLNMGLHVGDQQEAVQNNRQRVAHALGYQPAAVVAGQQVHGTAIVHVTSPLCGLGHDNMADAVADTDGLLCTEPGIVLMAHAADCTLLFFYDPVIRCIGLAHAGWRGAVAGMGPLMVEALTKLGSRRENIRVALAPTIGPCCYQVGENVITQVPLHLQPLVMRREGEAIFFDLAQFQRLQLLEMGISNENLSKSTYCTACNPDLFYSYRAAGGQTGRMAGVISMKW
ncbi:MAG: peptidoglycan editing factor PgeF [Firmicutes bacterium]|nr:peptidoglycan editing factor PgeF [Bacillota bacterium]